MRRKIGSNQDLPIHCKYDKLVSTFSLEPNPDNPNVHSNEQIKLLSKIIKKNGWRDKIVVSNQSGMIVRGHGRFEAAKLLKVGKVPIEYQDYETYADEVRDLVADNKISEFSHIDKDQMLKLFANVEDFDAQEELDKLGFTEDEIIKMFGEDPYGDEYLPDKLEDTGISGEDTRDSSFIFVYKSEAERQFYMEKFGIDGKKRVYTCEDFE